MTTQPREIVACVCCGVEGPRVGRGLIRSCYMRHYKAGSLDQFPKERVVKAPCSVGASPTHRRDAARLQREEFARLRRLGVAVKDAGSRIGVSSTTAWRYEAALTADGWCPPDRRPPGRSQDEVEQLRRKILDHLGRYQQSSFSVWELTRVVDPLHKLWTVQNLVRRLAADGLVEVVHGQRDPSSLGVPAHRYRLRAGSLQEAS